MRTLGTVGAPAFVFEQSWRFSSVNIASAASAAHAAEPGAVCGAARGQWTSCCPSDLCGQGPPGQRICFAQISSSGLRAFAEQFEKILAVWSMEWVAEKLMLSPTKHLCSGNIPKHTDQSCSWKQECFHHIDCVIYCGFPCCSFSGGCSWSDHEGTVQTHSEDRGSIWALPGSGTQLHEGDPSCEHQLRGVWKLEDDSGRGLTVTRRCWGLGTLKSWDAIPRHISHLSFCECVDTKLTKQSCEISDCESVRKGEGRIWCLLPSCYSELHINHHGVLFVGPFGRPGEELLGDFKAGVAEVSSQQYDRVAKIWVTGLLSACCLYRAVCLQMSTFWLAERASFSIQRAAFSIQLFNFLPIV